MQEYMTILKEAVMLINSSLLLKKVFTKVHSGRGASRPYPTRREARIGRTFMLIIITVLCELEVKYKLSSKWQSYFVFSTEMLKY